MGHILPRLPEAAPYGVEVRRESFYLSSWHEQPTRIDVADGDIVHVPDEGAAPRIDGSNTLVVPAADLPALHTAVLQAQRYVRRHLPKPVPGWTPGVVEWTAQERRDEIHITGPWVGFLYAGPAGSEDSPHVQVWAEVTYADLPGLVAVIAAALRAVLGTDEGEA